jgi:hypothetical protein
MAYRCPQLYCLQGQTLRGELSLVGIFLLPMFRVAEEHSMAYYCLVMQWLCGQVAYCYCQYYYYGWW